MLHMRIEYPATLNPILRRVQHELRLLAKGSFHEQIMSISIIAEPVFVSNETLFVLMYRESMLVSVAVGDDIYAQRTPAESVEIIARIITNSLAQTYKRNSSIFEARLIE